MAIVGQRGSEEIGELKVGTDMPEVPFKITIKDIIEVKGL